MRLGKLKVSYMWDVFVLLVLGAVWWLGWGQGVRLAFKLVLVYLSYCVQLFFLCLYVHNVKAQCLYA